MPRMIGQDLTSERLGLRYVLLNAYVYAVRRVNSSELLRQGYPTLEGSEAYAKLMRQHKEALEEYDAGLKDPRKTEEEKAQIREQIKQARERHNVSMQDIMLGDPDKAVAFLDRCRAYACAMVVKAGRLTRAAEAANIHNRGVPVLLDNDWDFAQFCEDLRTDEETEAGRKPTYLAPFNFVQAEEHANPAENVVWVHAFDNREIAALGTVLMHLQEVAGRVTATFRAGPGNG